MERAAGPDKWVTARRLADLGGATPNLGFRTTKELSRALANAARDGNLMRRRISQSVAIYEYSLPTPERLAEVQRQAELADPTRTFARMIWSAWFPCCLHP